MYEAAQLTIVFISEHLAINGGFHAALEAEGWRWIEIAKMNAIQDDWYYRKALVAIGASMIDSSVRELIFILVVKHNVPVVVFCANFGVPDFCEALDAGAEEVISVPFIQAEAIARFRAIARVRFGAEP